MTRLKFLFAIVALTIASKLVAQDSSDFRLIVKSIFEYPDLSKDIFYANKSGHVVGYLWANENVARCFRNFHELYRRMSLPPDNQLEFLKTEKGNIFLILKMSLHYRDDIESYVVIDRVTSLAQGARITLHTTGRFEQSGQHFINFVCWLRKYNDKWLVEKVTKSKRGCCDKM